MRNFLNCSEPIGVHRFAGIATDQRVFAIKETDSQ